jgi:hypothetical protein
MTAEKTVERSVDTLQRVYAVIVALAINEGIKRTFLKDGSGKLDIQYQHLAEFVALIFTAVPFLHGMNRHLDQTLTLVRKEKKRWLFLVLVVDFAVFLGESCVLFLMAVSVTSSIDFFRMLMVLLAIDILWCLITWKITRSVVARWSPVNIGMVLASCILICGIGSINPEAKSWVLAGFAVIRTALDYSLAWQFYFPDEEASK